MPRPRSLNAYIALPTMDAHTTDAFVRRLHAQYLLHRSTLRRSRLGPAASVLNEKGDALGAALAADRSNKSSMKAAAELDPIVDASWAAIILTLEGRAKATELPSAAGAQAILDRVFPDRLKFTQEKYVRQWSMANASLQQLLATDDHGASAAEFLRAHGAGDLLDEVRRLHDKFAALLGVSEGRSAATTVEVRAPMDEALDAAREFVAITLSLSAAEIGDSVDTIKNDILSVIDEFATRRDDGDKGAAPPAPAT